MGACCSKREPRPEPYDFFRNSPLRYVGYAGHVASACCLLIPCKSANYLRMAATTYVMSDVFSKSMLSAQKQDSQKKVFLTASDTFVWHLLATVLFPGAVIQGVKYGTLAVLGTNEATAKKNMQRPCGPPPPRGASLGLVRTLPCLAGIILLPILSKPIDNLTTEIMNSTFRKTFRDEDDDLSEADKKMKKQYQEQIAAIKKEICKIDKKLKDLMAIQADWDKQDQAEVEKLKKQKEKLLADIKKKEHELCDKLKASREKREKELAAQLKKERDALEKELAEKERRAKARAAAKKAEMDKKAKELADKLKKEQELARLAEEKRKREEEQRRKAEEKRQKQMNEEAEKRKKREAELDRALQEKKKREC